MGADLKGSSSSLLIDSRQTVSGPSFPSASYCRAGAPHGALDSAGSCAVRWQLPPSVDASPVTIPSATRAARKGLGHDPQEPQWYVPSPIASDVLGERLKGSRGLQEDAISLPTIISDLLVGEAEAFPPMHGPLIRFCRY